MGKNTNTTSFIIRDLKKGLGEAVAKRTILRENEKWNDVAKRVALGNVSLADKNLPLNKVEETQEYKNLYKHIANASILMSGRHLQHGDQTQRERTQEVFTNCSTAATSFIKYYLLLNGSGVGRCYDDDLMLVNWDFMPEVICALSKNHQDYTSDITALEDIDPENKIFHKVADTREGWAKAIEVIEIMTYEKKYKNTVLVLDFSDVRPNGSPIGGMQGRPASGPVPMMKAIEKVKTVKRAGMKPWKQAMHVDHYLAECVLVGGVRRSARIAIKNWEDEDIEEYINIKKNGNLWSANNSIGVDATFWSQASKKAKKVFNSATYASYFHDTGEPGFINLDRLVVNNNGLEEYKKGKYVGSDKFKIGENSEKLLADIASVASKKKYPYIVNPCSEIVLTVQCGFCVIADVVPYFAPTLDDAEEAFRIATRALIRVNTMDSLYGTEVKRTNRIGVGMTGLHEYAWKHFGYGFRDLINEEKSKDFWVSLSRFKNAVVDEAEKYSKEMGLPKPHTDTTVKPAGSTSKLFGLSEGVHLPAMKEYLRWVQFRTGDPLIEKYKNLGYPVKELKTYVGTTIIGFPTQPEICKLGMNGQLVTAGEATPLEQYKWLQLLEKYWIIGIDDNGVALPDTGNQISYTLKYKKDSVSYEEYCKIIKENQSQVKCCSVMPQQDSTAYEYQPEEPISQGKFLYLVESIRDSELQEDIDLENLKCASGACPI